MELQDISAPRLLVEAVDVLGDDRFQLSRRLPLRQLFMGGVGLRVQIKHFVAVKAEKFLRIHLIEAVAQDGFRGVVIFLVVEAVGATEIGDAALRADPGPAEKDDVFAVVDPVLQCSDRFRHSDSSMVCLYIRLGSLSPSPRAGQKNSQPYRS